ncbi:hypothetical protein ElyMa_001918600 [Elysia marginata]|uniref:Uncharacterized protein n=1 Tax=Elysia marginata TaxID=1093978 RepID=A0AAV4EUJ8_9GAST|nr:hypothetical protein ElyMa_001918600 [Elysia marginata]
MDDNMLLHINSVRSAVRRSSFHTLWGSSTSWSPHSSSASAASTSTPLTSSEDCLQPYQFHGWEDMMIRQHQQRSRSRSRCYNRSLLLPDICEYRSVIIVSARDSVLTLVTRPHPACHP